MWDPEIRPRLALNGEVDRACEAATDKLSSLRGAGQILDKV